LVSIKVNNFSLFSNPADFSLAFRDVAPKPALKGPESNPRAAEFARA
jgi:hypothetical protein